MFVSCAAKPLLCWADIEKASTWIANHASDVHVVGLSSRRIAKLLQQFKDVQTFDEKTADGNNKKQTTIREVRGKMP